MKTKKAHDPLDDELQVELEVSARGTIEVFMTRRQYAEMKKQERHGAICLDMVPTLDWSELTNALDFEGTIENVFDDGKLVDP